MAPELLRDSFQVSAFVNADDIARGLSGFAPGNVAMPAGRIMARRLRDLMAGRSDFAFETLAGKRTRRMLEELAGAGYDVHLMWLWLRTPEQALARVKARAAAGGHDVPESDVRRRFERGLSAFLEASSSGLVRWRAYDAGGAVPRLIAHGARGGPAVVLDPRSWSELIFAGERR